MKITKSLTLLIIITGLAFPAFAQQVENPTDTLLEHYVKELNNLRLDLEVLKRMKINGWVQAQYQHTDTIGAQTVAGGNFAPGSDNRLMLRRGRIKFTYEKDFAQYVLQIDAIEPSPTNPVNAVTVNVRDFYTKITMPFFTALSTTIGMQNRPFGFEIAYSSQYRETPERSRFVQMLFPNERDLGAMLTLQPGNASILHGLKINGGIFNGTGIAREIDSRKDFIGQIIYNKATRNEKVQFGLGASYYNGGVRQNTSVIYSDIANASGVSTFVRDSSAMHMGGYGKREYTGFDAQVMIDSRLGMTTLRGEYTFGTQTGTQNSTRSFEVVPAPDSKGNPQDIYIRQYSAAYFYFVHKIARLPIQLVFKYDFYDPNTKVSGKQVDGSKGFGQGDIKYTTQGYGVNYLISNNVKLMCYLDNIVNEVTKVKGYDYDKKDNIYTIRIQYRF